MFRIGAHLSASQGYLHMAEEAYSIGANTFQYFLRAPRGGRLKPFNEEDWNAYRNFAKEHDIQSILTHAPYILNLASEEDEKRNRAIESMQEEILRQEEQGGGLYNFHPGSHVGQGEEIGIRKISDGLNQILFSGMKTTVLLELMAGKGSEIGKEFGEIAKIIEKTKNHESVGVCLDTCHVFDGGYDIVNRLDEVMDEFDRIIGLQKLKAVHLNDSKNPFNSHKDRHEKIGEGYIGRDAIQRIINHEALKD